MKTIIKYNVNEANSVALQANAEGRKYGQAKT